MLRTVTRRRALWLALAVVLLVVAALTTAALLRLSPLVRRAALWQLQSATGRPVTIAALDLSLADGRLSLRGLRVADRDGGVLAEVGRLEATFRPWSLLHGELWIQDLAVSGVQARIVRIGPGRFNISDLLDRPASSGSWLDVTIDHLALGDSQVTFEDRLLQPARTWRADDIRFDGRRLTTRGRGGTAVAFASVAGALVTVRADDVQLGPLHARANVNVRDLDLRLAALYLPGDGALRLERGRLNAGLHVVIDGRDGTRLDADAVIEGLALRRPGVAEDTVTAPRLDILVRELHQQPARIALRYASVGGNLTVLDPTQTPPRPLTFTDLTVTASDLEQPMKDPARVAVHANVPGGGEVDVTGTVGVTPRRADLRVRARGLELAALASHLPLTARVAGTGTADLRVTATHERAFGLTVAGDATVDRVTLGDGTRTLLAATRVSARGLEYAWPASLALGQLTLTQPAATIERAADGTLDLTALLRARTCRRRRSGLPGLGSRRPRRPDHQRPYRRRPRRGHRRREWRTCGRRPAGAERARRHLAWTGPGHGRADRRRRRRRPLRARYRRRGPSPDRPRSRLAWPRPGTPATVAADRRPRTRRPQPRRAARERAFRRHADPGRDRPGHAGAARAGRRQAIAGRRRPSHSRRPLVHVAGHRARRRSRHQPALRDRRARRRRHREPRRAGAPPDAIGERRHGLGPAGPRSGRHD